MATGDDFDLPVSPEQCEALGRVVTEWSYLESLMDLAIGEMSGVFDADMLAALTANAGFRGRFNTLKTLFSLDLGREQAQPAADQDTFDALCREIESLVAERNRLVHAKWIRGDQGSPMTLRIVARGVLQRTRHGASAHDVRAVALRIAAVSRSFRHLFQIEED